MLWKENIYPLYGLFPYQITAINNIEKDDNYIRIVDTRSVWNLSKITSDKTKVTLQSYAVIDGLPSFITDLFILESPMYSMTNLREKF